MTTFGYIRSTFLNQDGILSPTEQLEVLKPLSINVFVEEKTDPIENLTTELDELLAKLHSGDQVYVAQLHRLGRDTAQLHALFKELAQKNIEIIALDKPAHDPEQLHTEVCLKSIFRWLRDHEAIVRKERFITGMARARKQRTYGGRKNIITFDLKQRIKQELALGLNRKTVAENLNISRTTLAKAISQIQEEAKHAVSA